MQRQDVQSNRFDVHPSGKQLAEIARLVDSGKLKYIVDHVYSLEQVQEALKRVEGGHAHGKVVLKIA